MAETQGNPLTLNGVDISTQEIILAAAHHDVFKLRTLLRDTPSTGAEVANVKDAETGYTPLHAAIASMSAENVEVQKRGDHQSSDTKNVVDGDLVPQKGVEDDKDVNEEMERAIKTVQHLFENGAIWNELDTNQETPGCLAWRLGLKQLYELVVAAGIRAELLFQRLDGYEPLGDDDSDVANSIGDGASSCAETETDGPQAEAGIAVAKTAPDMKESVPTLTVQTLDLDDAAVEASAQAAEMKIDEPALSSPCYLTSRLTFTREKLLDDQGNAVMMEWERDIMQRTVSALLPPRDDNDNLDTIAVLNVGHGMGIIDGIVQNRSCSRRMRHHIIEAHPSVITQMRSPGGFLDLHESNNDETILHEGRWQDILPRLAEQNLVFDAIFFDTFAEDYSAFRTFFEEWVIALLKEDGRWSFFHGFGADRRVCYDIYTKVVEMDLFETGFDVEWEKVAVPDLLQRGEWTGVKRPYWALDEYRLPVCMFTGQWKVGDRLIQATN